MGSGQVPALDLEGSDKADEAADYDGRRVPEGFFDARWYLLGVCSFWSVAFNADDFGGTDPCVWSAGLVPKRRRVQEGVRNFALPPWPQSPWEKQWSCVPQAVAGVDDVAVSPYSVGKHVKVESFLGSLHWPFEPRDLGVGGVSYLELLVLHELWAGERLTCQKAVLRFMREARPIACDIGANHGRLGHLGWERWSHGLTSRPRDISSVGMLDEFLCLTGYPLQPGTTLPL